MFSENISMFYRVLFEQFLNVDYEASDTKELPLQPFRCLRRISFGAEGLQCMIVDVEVHVVYRNQTNGHVVTLLYFFL